MFDFNKGKKIHQVDKQPAEEDNEGFEKYFLAPMAKFTGIDKVINLAKPVIEAGTIGVTSLFNKELANKMLLNKPQQPATEAFEKGGIKEAGKVIGGQAIQAAVGVAPWAKGVLAAKGATKIARSLDFAKKGAAIGAGYELGEQLSINDVDAIKVVKEGLKGGVISFLFNQSMEGLSGILFNRAQKLYGRGLKPDLKDLQTALEKNYKTIASKFAEEGYVGTAKQIKNAAITNKKKYGKEISKIVKKAKGTIYKKEVIKDLEELVEKNDVLDETQLNLIIKQIDKIPDEMTVVQANKLKQEFAERVSAGAWSELASKSDTFRNQMYKTVTRGLRKEVEKKVSVIKAINEKWAIALDAQSLGAKIEAQSLRAGGLAEGARGGLVSLIMNLPVVKALYGTASRTGRGYLYQKLGDITKQNLIQMLGRYITLEEIQQNK